ncbi:MAG: PRC-barrel domain-containing protein [Methanosarcina sp.]
MARRDNPEFLSASTIKGDKIVNRDGEDLGKIEELMIDLQDGRVAYAVLSFGGFLGMGNKLFAIPWQAFKLKLHDHAFILDIDKEVLEKAEGFDKDNWPLTNREWLSRNYTYYGYQPYWQTGLAGQTGMPGETEPETTARMRSTASRDNPDFLSADTIKGDKVVNRDGDHIGKIDELMIDLQDGKVAYAVISHGGILGIGTKLFAIPWQALSLRVHEHAFVLDIPKETFDKAEGFDKDNWPLTRNELSRTYDYYGYQPYWQAVAAAPAGISTGILGETEAERMARMERERSGLVETEEERKARMERERLEGLRETQEEKVSHLEEQRMQRERQTETERERLARLEREQMELERQAEIERGKLVGLEKELQEAIRLEQTEKVSRLEKEMNVIKMQEEARRERLAQLVSERERVGRQEDTEKEKLSRLEEERMEAEKREESEKEKLAGLGRERMEAERKVETEQERLARLESERMEAERKVETEQERLSRLERERMEAEKWQETESARMARMGGMASRENTDFLSATTIKGDKVINTAGEDLGKIEELMIDLRDGRIAYAVLSFGGFLGMGDKLFAIPWQSLRLKLHDHAFVLDIPKETLEKAEGFDKDNWPVTSHEWLSRTYTYYGYEPYWQREVTERTGLPGEIGSERVSGIGGLASRENPDFLSAGTMKGDKVVNTAGEDLGKIEELMIDLHDGRVAYAVLSFGGFLGMSDKLFAIPWQALSLRVHEHAFVLDIPKDVLERAEGFDKDNWPLTRNELSRTYTYYGYQPYWQQREVAGQAGISTGVQAETESERMARTEREKHEQLKTAEEKMAQQDKERIERMEGTETDKEKRERLERERMVAERREHKYQ